MFSLLKRAADRWANWLGDRDLDLTIRKQLTEEGYLGDSARLRQCRLVAVERPGWLQILVFSAEARAVDDNNHHLLHGLVRQDERYNRLEIRLFQRVLERNELFSEWSEDLVKVRQL